MFTGIIEEIGMVEKIAHGAESISLYIRARKSAQGLRIGDSLAVNGCCLTVVKSVRKGTGANLQFNLLKETWDKTNLQFAQPGTLVNLERPLRADGRLGGHFITGHIDGMGKIAVWEKRGKDWLLEVDLPASMMPYVISKGSVAVDGISLTVSEVRKKSCRMWIIPHTFENTDLSQKRAGDRLNIETDLLGKYVKRCLAMRRTA